MGGLNLIQLKNDDIGAQMGGTKFTNTKLLEPNINTFFYSGESMQHGQKAPKETRWNDQEKKKKKKQNKTKNSNVET
jgi:hypothetical protein